MTSNENILRPRLDSSGLEAGAVGLGCMGMTWAYGVDDRDEARSIAVIHHALERGVTLVDTADMTPSRGFWQKEQRSLRAGILLPCYLGAGEWAVTFRANPRQMRRWFPWCPPRPGSEWSSPRVGVPCGE